MFHGGNATTAYNLLMCSFLLNDFHIYAVDTIGHPGKSDEVCLPSKGYDYGKWASEVIDKIGYDRIACLGGSFGGGILAKLMCVAPQKIEKAVLIVPARKVLPQARRIILDCQTIELKQSGHMHILPQMEKERIVEFLRKG